MVNCSTACCRCMPDSANSPPDCTYMDGKVACMSRAVMLLHVINHGSYHRGAVGELLHQCGLPVLHDVLSRFLN